MIHDLMNVENAYRGASHLLASTTGMPSNQEIIKAARSAYRMYEPVVDPMTKALVHLINSDRYEKAIDNLDGANWLSPGVSPELATPIFDASQVRSVMAKAQEFSEIQSFCVGVYSQSLPNNDVGVIGFNRNLQGDEEIGFELKLDLFKNIVKTEFGQNLQLGFWLPKATNLHNQVIGLYTKVNYQGISVNLKVLLELSSSVYGFVVSTGAEVQLPITSAVFGGNTSIWGDHQ